jgi:hypothetical protein
MDGVVIHVSRDMSRAIVWCSDHGPLGLARRDAMPPASQPPLQVGEVVRFEAIDDAGLRLCGRLTRVGQAPVAGLASLLQDAAPPIDRAAVRPMPRLRLVASRAEGCAAAPC